MSRTTRPNPVYLAVTLALACAAIGHAAQPDLTILPAALDFKYTAGAALPASQALSIKSTGAALTFTVSITGPLPYSAAWLSVSVLSGTTTATLNVFVNPTSLPGGSYSGSIVVTAAGALNSVHTIPVTLEVANSPGTLTASTPTLTFSYTTGQPAPASQPVELFTNGNALTVNITITGATWLSASPSGGISLVGLPGAVQVSVNPTGLAPGAYTASIAFASTDAANKSVTLAVTLNVSAATPSISAGGIWPPGVLAGAPATVVTITGSNFISTSAVTIGSTTLTKTLVGPNTILATIPASLLLLAGNLQIVVTTPSAQAPSAPATFTVYGPGPQIWAVANGASSSLSNVSPGGIVTLYGIGLGPANIALFPGTNPVPISLPASGPSTSVTINGLSAPILYTSSGQLSCIAPYAIATQVGNSVNVIVTYSGTPSASFPVTVVATDPGIFTLDASGIGQGAILNYNGVTGNYTVNSATNQATAGSTVVLYATGFGAITCVSTQSSACTGQADETQLVTGTVTPSASVGVTIGGQTATVQAAVAPIGSVAGVLQLNVTVPAGIAASAAVPVALTFGTSSSQTGVTIALK